MFRTELSPAPSQVKINLKSPILLVGSCFSDQIGGRLQANKFDAMPNPFGVIYNPISIFKLLVYSILDRKQDRYSFVQRGEIWYNYHFHSEVSALEMNKLEQLLAVKQGRVGEWFAHTAPMKKFLIITLGTAYVYQLKESGEVVANCHKMPAQLFEKQLLYPTQIIKEFEYLYGVLPKNLEIILTVSPVRHLKDTLPLNAVSKAVLRVACHELSQQFDNVHYFPAYELVLDDLRDYRFYEADMLHPNTQAIDYVFDKFANTFFDEATQLFVDKWEKIAKSLQHKPFFPETKEHQQFLRHLLAQLESMVEVEVEEEIEQVQRQLKA
jgi:GSCFA family